MTGAGPMAIRELARRLNRDARAVHSNVHALLNYGILDKTADAKIEFPYDAVHVDFTITNVA
jgi:predicted transcriptional regulator